MVPGNLPETLGTGSAQTWPMTPPPRPGRGLRALAAALGGFVLLEVVAAAALSVMAGWSWQEALEAFVVTNSAIGLSFGICGAILAWHRPHNPIGWLFAAGGVAQSMTAVAAPLGAVLHEASAPIALQRLVITIFSWSWPWSIGLFLPLALLLFPDGRPVSRGWRWVVVAVIITSPLFALEMGAWPGAPPGYPIGYLTIPFYDRLQPLWTLTELRGMAALVLGLIALFVRYRRGNETQRRQLLWLVLALIVVLIGAVPWSFVSGTPVAVLFTIPLIPLAVTVAIIRHQLLDIRLAVSRLLAWVLLSLAVVVAYAALVAVLDQFISEQLGRSAIATVLLVLLAAPVLPRLQRLVERAVYGDRSNPARVVSRVGEQLATPDGGLVGVVAAIREALRLPYVAVEHDGAILAADGEPPPKVQSWPLTYDGRPVGKLQYGLRRGERRISDADSLALDMLAAPVATALHATLLTAELQASRLRILSTQEEERRRLRRELHDGLGPTLTGIAFGADAAANLITSDPDQANQLLTTLRRDTRAALADVRRLVDDLRPRSLDELGLVGALQQRAEQLAWRADGEAVDVKLDVPGDMPPLPPAVEVATYRVATEALTNVVRHSKATEALVRVSVGDRLEVSVTDDGPPNGRWSPGVGLTAMRERVTELGGEFEAGPSATGGQVVASIPLP
jgi:two-component system, NarL family, sensor kinase